MVKKNRIAFFDASALRPLSDVLFKISDAKFNHVFLSTIVRSYISLLKAYLDVTISSPNEQ